MPQEIGIEGFKQHSEKFSGVYRGTVIDNDDPLQYGRVKIMIYPMLQGMDVENLPWATPASGLWDGAAPGCGSFVVPKIDSNVFCFFEGEDIYQPVYFAEAQDAVNGLPAERTADYPNTKVFKTSSGVVITINDTTKKINITQQSGVYIDIDASGNVTIKGTTVSINP